MAKIKFLLVLLVLFSVAKTQAQDTISSNNPLAEPRFDFFKETVIVFNEYLDRDSGSYNTTMVRVLLPLGNRKWNLRAEAPLVSTTTNSLNASGLGDVSAALTYVTYVKNKTGIAFRAKVTANSAVDPAFGSGKWIFTPTIFMGNYLGNNKKFLLISSLENQMSFAGSSNRSKVNTTVFENTLLYFFGKNWVGANAAIRYNSIVEGWQNTSFVEFGRKITPKTMLYVHPSVAYGSEKSYNYGVELGLIANF